MSTNSKIEWTNITINPIRARWIDGSGLKSGHYCEKVSSGCANCYSSNFQKRFGMPPFPGKGTMKPGQTRAGAIKVYLDEKVLASLLTRRKPAKVFWCDMTDMFGPWVPFDWIDKCFSVMALTPHLTHQVLTKRPERMAEYFSRGLQRLTGSLNHWFSLMDAAKPLFGGVWPKVTPPKSNWWPLPNVWLGTSVENQQAADERIPHLLKCPAAVRFLSCEPLLGAVNLESVSHTIQPGYFGDAFRAAHKPGTPEEIAKLPAYPGIGWVIVGGESGPKARPCDVSWIRSIVQQCAAARVKCFVKQLGARPLDECPTGGVHRLHCEHPKGGDMAEWPADLRVRQLPAIGGVK